MEMEGKLAVVTGSSRGIGLHFAQALVEAGMQVAGWSRTEPAWKHPAYRHYAVDITDAPAVEAVHRRTVEDFGQEVRVLINNAGRGWHGPFWEMPLDNYHALMALNVHAMLYTSRLVTPPMLAMGEGHIVNISSGAGGNGVAQMAAYSASKHAVRGLSHSMHAEVRHYGVKVSCLAPGSVESHFGEAMGRPRAGSAHPMQPDDLAQTLVHMLRAPANYHFQDVEVRPLMPKGKYDPPELNLPR
jgi:short-subunit dehydrogenase